MANRLSNPNIQFLDASGEMLAGGLLYFYVTLTSTPADTYTTNLLAVANANPVVLDASGRAGNIFLDPAVTYKAVLKDSAGATIWTADPVVDLAANITAAFQVYAGNPNGFVAGNAGSVGGSGASVVWDITNRLLYVCTTSGVAAVAVWTQVGASLAGQVTQIGEITPTTLAANTDNWNPTTLSTSSVIRVAASSAVDLTGITAQPTGTLLTIHNIGTFAITFRQESALSTAANRFLFDADVALAPNASIGLRYDGVSTRWRAQAKVSVEPFEPGGRLTLTTAVPVLVADVLAATTIYYTPYKGFFAPLYTGSSTAMVNVGAELSLALSSNAAHTGYHQSGKNFDLFLADDAGTLRLVTGPAWTSDTARATALEYKNGFLCNAASMTARFGSASGNTITVAQDRGLYLGTFRATADGQTAWVAQPAAAAGGGACTLYLWNMYNRVQTIARSLDSTASWTYTTATWRAANNNNANRISVVRGVNEEAVWASYKVVSANASANQNPMAGIGLDSTSAPATGLQISGGQFDPPTNIQITASADLLTQNAGLGLHYFQAIEYAEATGSQIWYGTNTYAQMALLMQTRM